MVGGHILPALGLFLTPPILSGRVFQAVGTSWSTALDATGQSGLLSQGLQFKPGQGPVELVQSIASRFGGLNRCFLSFHSSPDVEQSIQIMVMVHLGELRRLKVVLEIHWQHSGLGNLLAECGEFAGSQVPW